MSFPSDLEIASGANLKPLTEIAAFRRSVNRRMWAMVTLLGAASER